MRLLLLLCLTGLCWGQEVKGYKHYTPCYQKIKQDGTLYKLGSAAGQRILDYDQKTAPIPDCRYTTSTTQPCSIEKPEPMDVPATRIPIGDGGFPACIWWYDDKPQIESCWDINGKPKPHATPKDVRLVQWKWTCADPARILLTDESGGKHCLSFKGR